MKLFYFSVLAAAALSACTSTVAPLEMSGPPVNARVIQGAPVERIRSTRTNTTIRAYQVGKTEDGKESRVEVGGANCKLRSDHLVAEIVTPQVVRLPKYDQLGAREDRGVPPSVVVNCEKAGLRGQALIAAQAGEILAGSGNLVADMILIAGSAAVAATKDWSYVPAAVVEVK